MLHRHVASTMFLMLTLQGRNRTELHYPLLPPVIIVGRSCWLKTM